MAEGGGAGGGQGVECNVELRVHHVLNIHIRKGTAELVFKIFLRGNIMR
jgi:hypothetical protein